MGQTPNETTFNSQINSSQLGEDAGFKLPQPILGGIRKCYFAKLGIKLPIIYKVTIYVYKYMIESGIRNTR